MRKFFIVFLLFLAASCYNTVFAGTVDEVTIGAILSLSQSASLGLPARRGIEIAVNEINAKNGIKGKKLKVVFEDSKDSSQIAIAAFQKLVSTDQVKVIIGPMTSGEVLDVAAFAQQSKVVIITPSGTSPYISDSGEYIYRGCTSVEKQAEVLTKYAKDQMKTARAAILYSNEPYGRGCSRAFSRYFSSLGIPIVIYESFAVGDRDFSAQLKKIKNEEFDLLLIPGYFQETAPAILQAFNMGITTPSMGAEGDMSPRYFELAGKAAEGHVTTSEYNEDYDTPANKAFKAEYYKIVNANANEPNNIMFAAITYDMTRLVADAIAKQGNQPDAIRSYLDTVKDFDGVTGKLGFDKNGDVIKPGVYIFKVVNGKFVNAESVAASAVDTQKNIGQSSGAEPSWLDRIFRRTQNRQ